VRGLAGQFKVEIRLQGVLPAKRSWLSVKPRNYWQLNRGIGNAKVGVPDNHVWLRILRTTGHLPIRVTSGVTLKKMTPNKKEIADILMDGIPDFEIEHSRLLKMGIRSRRLQSGFPQDKTLPPAGIWPHNSHGNQDSGRRKTAGSSSFPISIEKIDTIGQLLNCGIRREQDSW
jgi:hypothetical protein